MHVSTDADAQAAIVAKIGHIDLVTQAIGCDTDPARAELTGMSERQWRRARRGSRVGDTFIANLITALRPYAPVLKKKRLAVAFDDLFDIVPRDQAGEDVAE